MHSHLHLRRSLGLALSGLALASAPAPAMPVDRPAGLTSEEQQVLASRGVGATAPAVDGSEHLCGLAALPAVAIDEPRSPLAVLLS